MWSSAGASGVVGEEGTQGKCLPYVWQSLQGECSPDAADLGWIEDGAGSGGQGWHRGWFLCALGRPEF